MIGNIEKVVATDRGHLKELIKDAIEKFGPDCDLNFIDVSKVTDMHDLFNSSMFDGDISKWDISKVGNKEKIFG